MKNILLRFEDKEFEEHIDSMELTLFKEKKLSEEAREDVFHHLSQCKRCREVFEISNELTQESDKKIVPANNLDYKGIIKPFIPFAAGVIIFLGVPQGDKYFNNNVSMKGTHEEKNILMESVAYWEALFNRLFMDK